MAEALEVVDAAGAVAPYYPPDDTGMEDFDQSDMVMPTVRIDHKKGVFVDGLSGEEFPSFTGILLGLIKQRVLWEPEIDEGGSKGPLCKSYNFNIGHPDVDRFPWKESGFPKSEDEGTTLPCESCVLKDWGTHPKRDTPWCSEQHTFAVLLPTDDEGNLAPALLTIQRSAIKPSRTYLTAFARSKTPLYTVFTKIELDHRSRGQVDYAVPKFQKGGPTDQSEWPEFAKQYRDIREFVQTPRGEDIESEDGTEPTPGAAPAAAPADPGPSSAPVATAAASAPSAAATAPAAEVDEDDLPF